MTNNKHIYKKASFGARFVAYFIDLLIIFVLSIILGALLIPLHVPENLINLILPLLYCSLFLWINGATPGKMLCRIKVVNESYQPLGFGTALLRETIGKAISGIVFSLGFLWALLDKKNQTWHDKIAKTYVVKINKSGSLIQASANEGITHKRKISFGTLFFISVFPFIILIIYIFFFRPFQISGDAMIPNFKSGQYYMSEITKGPFKRGDVIILKAPYDPNKDFIKRVIALPGETVLLHNGSVYINNHPIDLEEDPYLGIDIQTYGGTFLQDEESITVPDNSYFVLGDNRPFSSDSREWGFVPQGSIVSKILFCYWNCENSTK